MANRLKEDEKNERVIRNLLKLPDNRRCINCNSLGPQYVCTNFWTFICTNCSGIHREFTHRVKSVSMAKFTSQEVSALQGGGNASAKEIYLKEWDPQRNSLPDSSNVDRLRDFIKHVYVDRRYTGEKSSEKPPRAKMGETEDSSEHRKMDSYLSGSRSPPYEDTYERRYSDRPSPGGRSDDRNYRNSYDERRSPGSDSDYRKSPARPEIVNDWRRDDRFGNAKKPEDSRIDGGSKLEGRSPDRQRDLEISSPPMVRPVREILGENVSPLRVILPPPKANGGRAAEGPQHTLRTASSSSLASSDGNAAEVKVESSLIDFDAVPDPPVTATVPQTQQIVNGISMAQQTITPSDNWANFGSGSEVKVSQAPSNANLLESVFSELSVPAPFPGHGSSGASTTTLGSNSLAQVMGNASASPFGSGGPAVPISNSFPFPSNGVSTAPVSNSFANLAGGGQLNSLQTTQQFLFPGAGGQPPAQPFTSVVGGASSNQPWNSLVTPTAQVTSTSAISSTADVRPTGKKELPEDLFTANYSSFPPPMPGWNTGAPYGYGFNMQYNTAPPVPSFSQQSKSSNPFDVNNEPSPVQASTFPSMIPLQGALPHVAAPTGLMHTSSLGAPSPWMPPQSSHPGVMASHAPSYASAVPPSSYMGQHVPSNVPFRQQGAVGIEQAGFGTYQNQQPSGFYAPPAAPNTFSSVGGNPFG